MSKSLGNVVDPVAFSAKYSRNLLMNYLFSSIPIGGDGDFSEKEAVLAFNAKLANNVGNLLNRFLVLSLKAGGEVPVCTNDAEKIEIDARFIAYSQAMDDYDLRLALQLIYDLGDYLNKFIDTEKPWDASIASDSTKVLQIMSVL